MSASYFTKFLLLIFVLFSSKLFAQQQFVVKGAILEKGNSIRIALAQITNKRTKQATGSNDLGLFQIQASIGDTLEIIKRNFTTQKIRIASNNDLLIYLYRSTIILDNVVIKGQTKKQELDEIKREYKRKGSFYGGKPPLLAYFFKPLTAIYELIGKTPRQARHFNKYYETEIQQSTVDRFFNDYTVSKNTSLIGKDFEKFMVDYRPDYEKAKNWNQYDAIKYIKLSEKKFTDTLRKVK